MPGCGEVRLARRGKALEAAPPGSAQTDKCAPLHERSLGHDRLGGPDDWVCGRHGTLTSAPGGAFGRPRCVAVTAPGHRNGPLDAADSLDTRGIGVVPAPEAA